MPLITPYSPSDLVASSSSTIQVAWQLPGVRSGNTEQVAAHVMADSSTIVWPTSLIECRHPEGKLWRSMFIPTSPSGSVGFSLTWWGKDDLVKGQAQVKAVSETEWYSVVKSKAVSKGYEVQTYIGRQIPLNTGHQFVKDLASSEFLPKLPVLAMSKAQSENYFDKGTGDKIGSVIGKAIANILPTSNFLNNLNGKGHPVGGLLAQAFGASSNGSAKDVVGGIMRELTGDLPIPETLKKAPEPQIDREEVYGSGWGAFG